MQTSMIDTEEIYAGMISDKTIEHLYIKEHAIYSCLAPMAISDLNGIIIDVNKSFLNQWGYQSTEEIIGKSAMDFWETSHYASQALNIVQEDGRWEGELGGKRKDGSCFDALVAASVVTDKDGQPIALISSFNDITTIKKSEKALQKSEERYRLLAENLNDIIWAMDMDFNYTYISPSVERLRGYTATEAMTMPWHKVMTENSYNRLLPTVATIRDQYRSGGRFIPDEPLNLELELLKKDGSTFWAEVNANFVYEEESRPVSIIGTTRDITERKKADHVLGLSEQRYRTIFENTGTATIILDQDTTISIINTEFEALCGYSRQEVEGKKSWKEFCLQQDLAGMKQYLDKKRLDPEAAPKNYEFGFIDRTGGIKNILLTVTLIPGTTTCVASLLDITHSKKVQDALMHSREQLRNLHKHAQDLMERERVRVAREIHDELGQVLTALKIDLYCLRKKLPAGLKDLQAKTSHLLRSIDMTIQSVKRIIMDLRPGLLDHLGLAAAIEWQTQDFQERTGIVCEIRIEDPDICISKQQATEIFRIFQEALTNITRHANASRVCAALEEKDGCINMIVEDNGDGITEEQMNDPKSFGLMGIKERAFFCGGKVDIIGQKDRGTTVIVSIPREKECLKNDKNSDCR